MGSVAAGGLIETYSDVKEFRYFDVLKKKMFLLLLMEILYRRMCQMEIWF